MMLRILIVLLAVTVVACEPTGFTREQDLIEFIHDPDNGLEKTSEAHGIKITVTYKPTDLLMAQELKPAAQNELALQLVRKKYEGYYYFLVSLSQDNHEALNTLSGMESYSDLVETMSFRMGDYVTMTTNQSDTIPVADFILNRTFNMSKSTDLLFVFSRQKAIGKEWVQFNLNEFGLNIGNHRFRFRKKDLDSVPALKFPTPSNP